MHWYSRPYYFMYDVFFPNNCLGCNSVLDTEENLICNVCIQNLPKTQYWTYDDNTVGAMFYGKALIERACSFLYFSKGGTVQKMLHHLKYNSKPEVGIKLGELFGKELKESAYSNVDVILPIPLHKTRLKKRGYNQSAMIAEGMANEMGCEFWTTSLARLRGNSTQTQKTKYERYINTKELFRVTEPAFLENKNVLLVDDVVTTGSTLEACIHALLKVENIRLSVATIACPSII